MTLRVDRRASWLAPLVILLAVPLTAARSARAADEPIIDGAFSEWDTAAQVVEDETGDATAAFDISHVGVQAHGTRLYIHFDIGRELNLQAGPGDEGTLQLWIDLANGRRLSIDFRNRFACWADRPDEQIAWTLIKYACLPTFAAKEYELRVDLSALGAHVGDTVKVQFDGSDSLKEPITVVLADAPTVPDNALTMLKRAGDVRVVNLNTFYAGLSHAPRSERIGRLLASVDADIFCFQEELSEEAFLTGARRVVPRKNGADLHLHWQGDCGIATCWPLQPVPMDFETRFSAGDRDDRRVGAAAAIELPNGKQLVVCSVHLSCCGSSGDPHDKARVRETRELARQIDRLRKGEFGEQLRDAAVVVVGDYNLVGSRQPLTTLESKGLKEYLLRGLVDRSACTWRGDADESFWPGRLDLLTYDAAALEPKNGFILDSADLSASLLSKLGLQRDDSTASDHLMLVADFALRAR